ncbi:30S ribosomal protein S6 [Candidatus Peregrinibacteria bacterium]|nr:30S ribosomal protein S6 [Candidatus Peregrinibacteria bacterium]
MENENNFNYEIMILLRADLGEELTNKEIDEIKNIITSNNGEIIHEDAWGIKDLAYRIRKEEQGFYVVLNFSMEPKKLEKLEKSLNINPQVLRYLIIKTPPNYEIKSLEEYEEEAEKEEKRKKEKAPTVFKKPQKKKIIKKEKTEIQKEPKEKPEKEKSAEEKPAEEKPEKKEETEEEKSKKEELSKSKLSEVDEKLKSIINDPDISL